MGAAITPWIGPIVLLMHKVPPALIARVAAGSFHRIVLREGKIPQIDPHDFAFKAWTSRSYYEVCSNPDVYELIEAATQRAATSGG